MPKVTEHHKRILADVGEWRGTIQTFVPGFPAKPEAATESVTAVGKYWTQTTFKCSMAGMPYTGSGCVGYDGKSGKFIGTWNDSWSTHLSVMKGEWDKELDARVMRWQAPDMTGKPMWHRSVLQHKDGGRIMTFYMGDEGKEVKSMVIKMKRVGGAASRPAKAGKAAGGK